MCIRDRDDLRTYGLDEKRFTRDGRYDASLHAESLGRLVEVTRFRKVRPSGDLVALLGGLIARDHPRVQARSLELAGLWNVNGVGDAILAAAGNDRLPVTVREAAFGALVALKVPAGRGVLEKSTAAPHPAALRSAAVRSLVLVDLQTAAERAAELFDHEKLPADDTTATLAAFVNRTGGAQSLAVAMKLSLIHI